MARRRWIQGSIIIVALLFAASVAISAYHHMGEQDAPKFLAVYSGEAGKKLDNCATCHAGGTDTSGSKPVTYGSCQWCHVKYGYDGKGDIKATLNSYGLAYLNAGRNEAALRAIENADSDGDGYTNIQEISANTYPGDKNDDPSKVPAPAVVYTRPQLEAMPQYAQFLLMNVTKSAGGDSYVQYSGVTVEELLRQARMLPSATGVRVYSPDGFSWTHPLSAPASQDPKSLRYYVVGPYPQGTFYYNTEADMKLTAYGWCDYSAPSCAGRGINQPIPDDLRLLLGITRDGVYLTPGVLTKENKLDGEGPFRVIPPQVIPGPPDQSSTASVTKVVWPYNANNDHNAGAATRSATIVKVDPLPLGTTDINTLEAGWSYIDQAKIVVYGAIEGSDSNGNGIPDTEEGTDLTADFDKDGVPDFQDPDTATFNAGTGTGKILLHTSKGDLANVAALPAGNPVVPGAGKPVSFIFPYGGMAFDVAGVGPGGPATITLAFPGPVPSGSKYFVIDSTGWKEIPFVEGTADNIITLVLTDGNKANDMDATVDGIISHLGFLAVPSRLILAPAADTFVSAREGTFWLHGRRIGERHANFGDSPDLSVVRGQQHSFFGRYADWRAALLRFDLSTIPTPAKLIKAELFLYHHSLWGEAISIHTVKMDWMEDEANWFRPCNDCQTWCDDWRPDGNFAMRPTAVTTVDHIGWFSWDVTQDVKSYLSGTPNYGWFLRSASPHGTDPTSCSFYSKEVPVKHLRPYIRIHLSE